MADDKPPHRIIALVEDGYWRVKDTQNGNYLCSNAKWDDWHEDVRWVPRSGLSEHGWQGIFSCWGPDDEDLGMENGRAARMIASLADELHKPPSKPAKR